MFANGYTATLDACVLVPTLTRNLLLSLAEAAFYRATWSDEILGETERALGKLFVERDDPAAEAKTQVDRLRKAFPEAITMPVPLSVTPGAFPDPNDVHVVATAIGARASVIVTSNLRDFPKAALAPFRLEARSPDDFIADTLSLDEARAVTVIRQMRARLKRPQITAATLLLRMEANGLLASADILRPFEGSL